MEQMEILLNVPTISKSSVSSTPKSLVTDDDRSFADLYEQNVHESRSSNVESTQKSSKKQNESVDKSQQSEESVENKIENQSADETESTEESGEQDITSINWINVLGLATESIDDENTEMTTGIADEVQMASVEVDTEITEETSMEHVTFGKSQHDEVDRAENNVQTSEDMSEIVEGNKETIISTSTVVSTKISETTVVDGMKEETNDNEIAVNTVQNEVVAQTSAATIKQTTDTTVVNNDFSALMAEDLPQSNLQKSVMTQIESSLGKIVKTGNNEIRIQLEPENLGVLNIRVIAGKDGTQVVFKADSHQSSQLIAAQTESLKTMLNEAGIKVDQIVVNDFSFSQENFQDQQTFEQQDGKSSKFYKNLNGNAEQIETYDDSYDLPQTIVGLNYLI